MKKLLSYVVVLLILVSMLIISVSAETVVSSDKQAKLLNTEQYNINGKVVVFNMYSDNGTIYDTVDVYTDETKQERANVDSELVTKIDEILIERMDISDKYMPTSSKKAERGGTARAIGETLSNSALGTGTGENPMVRASHYTKRDKYEVDYYIVNDYYNGTLSVAYNGNQTLSLMRVSEVIYTNYANVEINFPPEYNKISDVEATRDYPWSNTGYLRVLNRGDFDATYLTELNVLVVQTTSYVKYGNASASAVVTSNW